MSVERTLWRVSNHVATAVRDPVAWAEGLRLHLQYAPLTAITMRIGTQQQRYLAMAGCGACGRDACRVGCRGALLRRLAASCLSADALCAVAYPQGLAVRPYRRFGLARPTRQAKALDTITEAAWSELRLLTHWQTQGRTLTVAALLAVGADGPDSATALRACGWRTLPLPRVLMRRWAEQRLLPSLPFGAAWNGPVPIVPIQASEAALVSSEPALPIISPGRV
ncbi:MAG: hypothetical protein AB4911_15575 [Oscillochloridaceae bacterium umkhey_bin13]